MVRRLHSFLPPTSGVLCPPLPPHLQEKLGLTHLVGTPLLRAYMHGFFIDNRLYGKAKAIAGAPWLQLAPQCCHLLACSSGICWKHCWDACVLSVRGPCKCIEHACCLASRQEGQLWSRPRAPHHPPTPFPQTTPPVLCRSLCL